MVKEKIHKGKMYFMCEECDMYYRNKEIAQQCETFCNEKNACSMEITRHAITLD